MFAHLGYDAATFQEIAERADITRPAINHYFPSKRALYQQVVAGINATVIDPAIALARREDTVGDRLRTFVRGAIAAHDQHQSVAAFLVTSVLESRRNPDLLPEGEDPLSRTRSFVEEVLRDAADDVAAPDPQVAADAVVAMLLGAGFYAGFVATADRLGGVLDAVVGTFADRITV